MLVVASLNEQLSACFCPYIHTYSLYLSKVNALLGSNAHLLGVKLYLNNLSIPIIEADEFPVVDVHIIVEQLLERVDTVVAMRCGKNLNAQLASHAEYYLPQFMLNVVM
jgi:hypothetical protein